MKPGLTTAAGERVLVLRVVEPRRLRSLAEEQVAARLVTGSWGGRCPVCGSQLYYVRSLDRYYCFTCRNYV